MALHGLFERKNLSSKYKGLKSLMEKNFNKKLFQSTNETKYDPRLLNTVLSKLDAVIGGRTRKATGFYRWKAATISSSRSYNPNQSTASMIILNEPTSRNPSPLRTNRSVIAALVGRRMDRSMDIAHLQTQNYQCKAGGQLLRKLFLLHIAKAFGKLKENEISDRFSEKHRGHLLKIVLKREQLDVQRKISRYHLQVESELYYPATSEGQDYK